MKKNMTWLKIYVIIFFVPYALFSQITKQDSLKTVIDSSFTQLNEVVIKGKKPYFESKSDRFVFNIENSSLSVGNNVWDVLKETPLVTVEQEKVSIVGFQNATVYINDRKSMLKGKDLFQYLKAMPSDNIVKIELITAPSAKYDASDGAIINLVLKKSMDDGLKGSFTLTDEQKKRNSQNGNVSLNYHKKRYSQSFLFSLGQNNEIVTENRQNSSKIIASTEQSNTHNLVKEPRVSVNTAVNFELDEKSIIGGVFEMQSNKPKSTMVSESYVLQDNTFFNQSANNNYNKEDSEIIGGGIYYNYKNERTRKNLDVSLDYVSHNRDGFNEFFSSKSYSGGTDQELINIYSKSLKKNHSLKVDYSQPFFNAKINVEFGGKINFLKTENPYDYREWNGADFVNDPAFSNQFHYEENINALYLVVKAKLFKRIDLNTGLRYENTNITTKQIMGDVVHKIDTDDFIPTINLNYLINQNNKIAFSYRTMLWRPFSNELNPFVFKTNANYWSSGNPFLSRATIQAARLNYFFKKSVFFLLSMEQVNNPILSTVEINNGVSLSKPVNINGKVRRYYFGGNYSTSFFQNKVTANLSSGVYHIDNSEIYSNSVNSYYNSSSVSLSGNNLFDTGTNVTVYFGYTSPYDLVNKHREEYIYNTYTISQNYKNFKFKLGMTDPFNLIRNKYTIDSDTGIFVTDADYNQRGVNFSVAMTFGNEKTKRTAIDRTDKGRSENGDSSIK